MRLCREDIFHVHLRLNTAETTRRSAHGCHAGEKWPRQITAPVENTAFGEAHITSFQLVLNHLSA
jgi:hypothetical protein